MREFGESVSEQDLEAVPEGFELMPEGLGFIDGLQPLYRRLLGGTVDFGLLVAGQHCNSAGICHGGVIMTLADIAAASAAAMVAGHKYGPPTVNISLDFIGTGKLGQWLQTEIEGAVPKRNFGFSRGLVRHRERVVARFSATFYYPAHSGVTPGADGVPGMWRGLDL